MKPVPASKQQALVNRLMKASGGAYTPATRRKYYISGPQWAGAYQGQALFHAPTREAIGFEDVIREYDKIGIGHWATHDTDVIPTEALGTPRQAHRAATIAARGRTFSDPLFRPMAASRISLWENRGRT